MQFSFDFSISSPNWSLSEKFQKHSKKKLYKLQNTTSFTQSKSTTKAFVFFFFSLSHEAFPLIWTGNKISKSYFLMG